VLSGGEKARLALAKFMCTKVRAARCRGRALLCGGGGAGRARAHGSALSWRQQSTP
jgi:ABC-type hemin transport system ATPase subunit